MAHLHLLSEWVLSLSSPASGAFRRCSPADSPVGALAHRGAPLSATHSNCNGSKRRRSPQTQVCRLPLRQGPTRRHPAILFLLRNPDCHSLVQRALTAVQCIMSIQLNQ